MNKVIVHGRGYPYSKRILYVSPYMHSQVKTEAAKAGLTMEAWTENVLKAEIVRLNASKTKTDVLNSTDEHDG